MITTDYYEINKEENKKEQSIDYKCLNNEQMWQEKIYEDKSKVGGYVIFLFF